MNRPMKAGIAAIALAALVAAAPRLVRADAQQQQSFRIWAQMNDCARLAAKQYPDHTPEANAKREAWRQNCLRQHHLPIVATSPGAGTGQ